MLGRGSEADLGTTPPVMGGQVGCGTGTWLKPRFSAGRHVALGRYVTTLSSVSQLQKELLAYLRGLT